MTLGRASEKLAHVFPGPPEAARRRLHQGGEGFTVLETGLGIDAFRRRHPARSESGMDAQWSYKLAFHGWSSLRNLVLRGMDRTCHVRLATECADTGYGVSCCIAIKNWSRALPIDNNIFYLMAKQ